jgi:S-adenosylmethionine hydrolase
MLSRPTTTSPCTEDIAGRESMPPDAARIRGRFMSDPIITLTTDFGEDSPYVAAMKGVILGINPAARLVDLSHQIPPQDVQHAAFFLAESIPYFPLEALHVVVIDPGVGSERAILYVELDGHRLVVPDNGCWTLLPGSPRQVIRVEEPRYRRATVSSTFHGRDIIAPAAAHLSCGLDPSQLGPAISQWQRLDMPSPWPLKDGIGRVVEDNIGGEVIFVDHFGNLITNIPAASVERPPTMLMIEGQNYPDFAWVRTYAEAEPGRLVVLVSSSGFVEVAVAQGNAARRLNGRRGTSVVLWWC